MDRQYRFRISTDGDKQTGFSHQNGASNSLKQGDRSPQESYRGSGTSNGLHQPTVQTSSYRFTLASVRTAEEQRSTHNAWNLVSSPSAQQGFSRGEYSSANHRTGVVNGFASSVTVQPKLNGQHNGEVRNGYVLGDKYSKPYVHAPFHYAQSLLKELREISSSVKSFESLTLNEPKAGIQQKRKAEALHNGDNSRQKLVKGQITLPLERDDSIESELGEGYATMPELLDTSTSSLSSASVETALERVVSLSPTPLSPSWTDEGDTLEISLDDQILDSSLDQSDSEVNGETKDDAEKSSSLAATRNCSYKSINGAKGQSSEPNLPDYASSRGQSSAFEKSLVSPRHCQSCDKERHQGNWPHRVGHYDCKVNGTVGNCVHQNDKTLCNSTKSSPNSDHNDGHKVLYETVKEGDERKDSEINSNCLSVSNKMQNHESTCAANSHLNSKKENASADEQQKSPDSQCLVHHKSTSGPSLYPISPCEDCPSSLICSGPLCTAYKRQLQEEEKCSKDSDKAPPSGGKTSPNRTTTSAKEFATKVAMSKLNYVTTAEVKLNDGNRNRSRTESSINMSPWVQNESAEQESPSNIVSSLDVIPTTPCVVLRSPVKTKVLLKNPQETSNKEMPCSTAEKIVEESSTTENAESTSIDTKLPSNEESASRTEQTSSAANVQKFTHENKIGSFITPSQEKIPPSLTSNSSPKKSISVPNLDDRPVIGVNADWKETTRSTSYDTTSSPRMMESSIDIDEDDDDKPAIHLRSRSLGRNENFPLSGFLKEDNIRMKKTRSLDRDSERTPPTRRRDMMDLPKLESSPRLPGRSKKTPPKSKDSDVKSPVSAQKPSSLKISLASNMLSKNDHLEPEKSIKDRNVELDNVSPEKKSDGSTHEKVSPKEKDAGSPEESRGITEELIQFR